MGRSTRTGNARVRASDTRAGHRRPIRPGMAPGIAAALLLVGAACAGPSTQTSGAAPDPAGAPVATGAAMAPAAAELSDQVVIRRTAYGVPHIRAETLRSAAYAMGWVQTEDYGMDVVEGLIRARGEWSRYTGAESVDSDALNRRRYARAVETYPLLSADARAILEGFAAGVNRYVEANPEQFPAWVEPAFDGVQVHARSVLGASPRSARSFLQRMERQEEERAGEGANGDGLAIWRRLAAAAPVEHPDAGSNVWALAPSRTQSGHAILVRNPHLSWDAGYYEAHVTVPGVLDFYGDFRLGGPFGIIGGFNQRLGWATTNNYPDLDEIYAFAVDPERPDHYLLDGESVPIERETVTVEFRNGPGLGLATREFLTTPYGPVIHRADGKVYVLSVPYEGDYRRGEQFLAMMRASSLDEWQEAMKMRAHPSSNLTYADADGNIFYVWNATAAVLPHRSGGDTAAVAVSTAAEIGTRVVEWDSLPQLLNPSSGYLHNENDEFHYTNLDAVFDPGDYPDHYPSPRLRLRSQHSLQLIATDERLSLEEVVERKHSMRMLLADRVKDDLVTAVRAALVAKEAGAGETAGTTAVTASGAAATVGGAGDAVSADELAAAIDLIERWDNTVARDSRGGVLFKTWWWRYVATGEEAEGTPASVGFDATPESLFAAPWSPDRPLETPRGLAEPARAVDAFEWAVKEAAQRYGAWDRAWGEVHRAVIGDVDVPVGGCSGALGCFRVLWFEDHPTDPHRLQVRGGDGWVFAVELRDDGPRAYSVLAYGQSDQPDNPHFADQLSLFAANGMKPVAFTEGEIETATIREYSP